MTKPPSEVGDAAIDEMLYFARLTPQGAFVEVGVYKGGTAWHLDQLAALQGRPCFLYDTFEGIPHKDPDDVHNLGDFKDTNYDTVRDLLPRSVVTKGVFPHSAIPMSDVAFLHLDCDQYRSIKESVLYLLPYMVRGSIIWFDDSPCLAGAARATQELFRARLKLSKYGKHYVEL